MMSAVNVLVDSCLSVESRTLHEAGCTALYALCNYSDVKGFNILADKIFDKLMHFEHSDDFNSLTSRDIDVWRDPSILMPVIEKINLDDIKITNADRKKTSARGARRGQFGSDFVEDEEWVEQVKREKAKKALEAKGAGTQDAEELKAKAETIRLKVQRVCDMLSYSCNTFSFLAANCPSFVKSHLNILIPSLMSMINNPLDSGNAFRSIVAICDNVTDAALSGITR
jgi:hypothetical protein